MVLCHFFVEIGFMRLQVRDETVRRNIEIFKIILKRASHVADSLRVDERNQFFSAFIHKLNGEIRFSDLSSEPLDSRDWVVVSFSFSLPKNTEEWVSFEVVGTDGVLFSWDGFAPEALAALRETIKTILLMAKFLPRLQSLTSTLKELSKINVDSFLESLSAKDLIHEAWYQIDRVTAELLLRHQPAGTFLFRQDEYAKILERQLSLAHKEPIRCITLTYINSFERVSDLALVRNKMGWVIYDDDPSLRGPIYPSAKVLLDSLKKEIQSPLLNI